MKNRKHKQYKQKKKQDSKKQKDPPAPGHFVGYSYNCDHIIHEVYHDFTIQRLLFVPAA
jgi:hypothetical protein